MLICSRARRHAGVTLSQGGNAITWSSTQIYKHMRKGLGTSLAMSDNDPKWRKMSQKTFPKVTLNSFVADSFSLQIGPWSTSASQTRAVLQGSGRPRLLLIAVIVGARNTFTEAVIKPDSNYITFPTFMHQERLCTEHITD